MASSVLNILLGIGQIVAGLFLLGTGGGALAGARLLLSGGLTLASAFMPRKSGDGGWKSSPRYGFDNAVNVTNEGSVVPVVFGREKIAPPIISANLVQEGDRQALFLVCLLGEGQIEGAYDFELNDTPIGAFPGSLVTDIKVGTATQSTTWTVGGDVVVQGFQQIARPYDVSGRLGKNESVTYQMRDAAESLALNFVWAGGLFALDNGKTQQVACRVRVEYKTNGQADSMYRPFEVPIISGTKRGQGSWQSTSIAGEWKTEAATQSDLRRQIRLDFPTAGAYTVRVTGTEDDDSSGTYIARRVPTLEGAVERVNDSRAYANRAVVGLKVYADEQLNGAIPRVTCVVKGVKCYDPRDGTRKWTRNPVLIAREILTNERWGLGNFITSADLDEGVGGTWRTMADECEATVNPRGQEAEARFCVDAVLDQKQDWDDWLTQVLATARMSLKDSDGLLKVVFDDAETGSADVTLEARVANTSTRHNVARAGDETSSLEVRHVGESERFNVVRARFTDETDGWRTSVIELKNRTVAIGAFTGTPTAGESFKGGTSGATGRYVWNRAGTLYFVQDDGATAFQSGETLTFQDSGATVATTASPTTGPAVERVQEMQLFFVTRPSQVVRELRYALNQSLMCPYFAVAGMGPGDVGVEAGDVADVSDDVHGYSAKRFRVLDVARDEVGAMRLSMREHQTAVYEDTVDQVPRSTRYADPVGAVPSDLRPPSDSGATPPANTTPPSSTPAAPAPSSPPPTSSGGTSTTPTPTTGTPSSKSIWTWFAKKK